MLNPKLRVVCEFIDHWCRDNQIHYSVVCDESDLQGVLLLKKDRQVVGRLVGSLRPLLVRNNVHLETSKVRGGTILALSLEAISEHKLASIIAEAGEEPEAMSFAEKITDAFAQTVAREVVVEGPSLGNFIVRAAQIVAAEGQFKSATQGMARANQTSLQRQRVGSDNTLGGPDKTHDSDDPQATTGASQPATGPATRFENRIAGAFNSRTHNRNKTSFVSQLNETLQGMATPNGVQPGDLFSKFAQALSVLGQNMGTGPLQDQLKKQGINWKKSDDGQSVILYVVNANTNAPQPIARISAATLEKPSDFETQLLNIMDFAKGDAPGTFKQQQQELQQQEKAAREIAKQLGPQDPSAIAQQMQPGQAAPAQPGAGAAPPTPAPQAAAQQAAAPKPQTAPTM